jgi:hypothetical protein
VIFFLYVFWPAPAVTPLGADLRLAVWMGVTWSMDVHTDAEISALAEELQAQNVNDVYVYVSYLKADGQFNPTYAYATDFTRRFHAAAPDIRLYAWLGVPITAEQPDGTVITN